MFALKDGILACLGHDQFDVILGRRNMAITNFDDSIPLTSIGFAGFVVFFGPA
jgi:hypothetical protein